MQYVSSVSYEMKHPTPAAHAPEGRIESQVQAKGVCGIHKNPALRGTQMMVVDLTDEFLRTAQRIGV